MCLAVTSASAGAQPLTEAQRGSVPLWVSDAFRRSPLDETLTLDAKINPFLQRGDFDGDGRADYALFVRDKASGKYGVLFVHRGGRVFVVGAGKEIGNGGDDFSWMDAWRVFDKGKVARTDDPPPILRGDALLVIKTESAGGLLWWNGREYRWYQYGD